ncbi:NADH:flavin oxidoreductase/NADH oxidase [Artomyces pyxidatus]|uniref:NADH:flavin oxidoreductase/NADH oxidase n=1 Tax=Artomyces pyxidatus TaxID=48021 RepID=A0ACB8TAY0_9AGAM|nr:NADH:flavin oxidoreductase/NADH oxidase [Artomyces pyxidatus]
MSSKLFQPITVGGITLQHRVVMAPLTRFRANDKHELTDLSREYYEQRAAVPGTLIIAEGTFTAPQAAGCKSPGMWSPGQIESWKKIVAAVHAAGSFIFVQLYAMGTAANVAALRADGDYPYAGASDVPLKDHEGVPRALTIDEIHAHTRWFADAARIAVHEAGFDGVEVHCAYGYLLDQFLQTTMNTRTDAYGGSLENRLRFPLEALDAVVAAVGAARTAVRISPWSRYQNMRMPDPIPTFSAFVERIRDAHPGLAFLHVVEPRIDGAETRAPEPGDEVEQNDFIREIWGPRPFLAAGKFDRASGMERADRTGDLIAYGRLFISNPDLVRRLKEDIPLNEGNRSTYYSEGAVGYTDYPVASA